QEDGELRHLKLLDDLQPTLQHLGFAVMRETVISAAQPEVLSIDHARHFQHGYARGIGLDGESHKLEEDGKALAKWPVLRHLHIDFRLRRIQPPGGGADFMLDFAHGREILVELVAIEFAESAPE